MAASQLETPEVNLYYTVGGSGPLLLILQGGAGNADGSEALATAYMLRPKGVAHRISELIRQEAC